MEVKEIAGEVVETAMMDSAVKDLNTEPHIIVPPEPLLASSFRETIPESQWVFFRRKKAIESTSDERTVKIGNQGFRVMESDYIGSVGDLWKPCFPGSYPVEQELLRLEGMNPHGPWYLPVYLNETPKSFRANYIDDEKLSRFIGKFVDTDRVRAIENDLRSLRRIVWQIHDAQKPQRMFIFVDYQNLYKSIQENEVEASLETIVDLVCSFGAPIRRQETFQDESLVYIFDFFNHAFIDLYTSWQNKGYNFVRVQSKSRSFNPTDDVIIERARKELHRLKNHIDVFCVISGDRIFHQVITEARILGKKTMVAAFSNAMSRDLYVASHMYCDLDFWLVREPRETRLATYNLVTGESA